MEETRGWNKPSAGSGGHSRKRRISPWRGVAAGVAFIALAGALWLWMSPPRGGVRPKSSRGKAQIADASPRITAPRAKPSEEVAPRDPHDGMVLSSTGVWQPTNRPFRAGSTKVHSVYTNRTRQARKDLPYRNATEQLLLQTFGREVGLAPFPPLKIPKKDMEKLVDILISDNPAEEGESADTAVAKEVISAAKAEMKKFIKNGGNPNDFFEYYHGILMQAYSKRRMAQQEILRIAHKEKDPELARMMQREVNERLEKEGIKPLKLDLSDDD